MRIYFLCSLSILLLAGAGVSVAQVRSQSEREHVRSLNNSILQLHQQLHDSSGGSTRTIRERALQIVKERANSLVSLMASDLVRCLPAAFKRVQGGAPKVSK